MEGQEWWMPRQVNEEDSGVDGAPPTPPKKKQFYGIYGLQSGRRV